ncbi:phytoene/squalene synthase family protein [Cerasibacillus terrae]|uniref:Phytoene/squalene synthase family protein n=2 Tax=Cerasibacillus terrae TaxID=2498845 RepID=A0A5C8NS56_9BACI|nr:phytoene/squalene synthase family protein [Cerasibacillus terrae]
MIEGGTSLDKKLEKEAMHVLKLTSRTFYIPIKLLKPKLRKTVGSAYLCMRAIDEIEDHIQLESEIKQHLLRETSQLLKQQPFDKGKYQSLIQPYEKYLPEVTIRLGDWIDFCPDEITGTVTDATSVMANGMAKWVDKGWKVKTEEDLDEYTYYVAGLVGIMLSDIWKWYDGTTTNRELAIGYGRGLQAVNVLRNVDEDRERGVQFFPDSWTKDDMFAYAEENLRKADAYMKDIKTKNILLFCKIPLALAKRTLKALKRGQEKMTRQEVEETVEQIVNE